MSGMSDPGQATSPHGQTQATHLRRCHGHRTVGKICMTATTLERDERQVTWRGQGCPRAPVVRARVDAAACVLPSVPIPGRGQGGPCYYCGMASVPSRAGPRLPPCPSVVRARVDAAACVLPCAHSGRESGRPLLNVVTMASVCPRPSGAGPVGERVAPVPLWYAPEWMLLHVSAAMCPFRAGSGRPLLIVEWHLCPEQGGARVAAARAPLSARAVPRSAPRWYAPESMLLHVCCQ
jgi:hypothetical protein